MRAGRSVDTLVAKLVEMATREGEADADRLLALRQIRRIAEGRRPDAGLVAPLLRYASSQEPGGPLLDAYETVPAARALAACGPAADALVYDQLSTALGKAKDHIPFLSLALALADEPDPSVTERLAVLAASPEPAGVEHKFLALALAARKDESRDWIAEIASNLKEEVLKPDQENAQMLLALMTAVAYAAPRLEATESLADATWGILEAAPPDELPFLPLVCYGLLERKPMIPQRVAAIAERAKRMSSPTRLEIPSAVAACLAMAATGVDSERNLDQAVRLMSWPHFTTADWYVLQFILDSMVEPRFLPSLAGFLTSKSAEVRQGALRMVEMMGPYAHVLLPEVERLKGEPALSAQATAVARTLRGPNEWSPTGPTEPQSGGN
jgi:hypothetical protein